MNLTGEAKQYLDKEIKDNFLDLQNKIIETIKQFIKIIFISNLLLSLLKSNELILLIYFFIVLNNQTQTVSFFSTLVNPLLKTVFK